MVQLLILLTLLLTSTVLSDSEDSEHSEEDFINIGSLISLAGTQGRSSEDFDENNYYLTLYPDTWPKAVEDCKRVFGGNNTLVAIETVEEWEFLKDKLEKYGGTVYWTSGMYDPSKITRKWRWAANNTPLPPFSPWGKGFPSTGNENLRVLVNATNRYDASWSTTIYSQTKRYICEVQKSSVPVPCYATNDLIIVLDSSGSIGRENYEKAKGFVYKLVRAFTVHKQNRIGFIIYSTGVTKIIDIKNTFTPAQITSIIKGVIYHGGKTYTNLGIDLAVSQLNSSPRKVPLNMVLLTDGRSTKRILTKESASRAISMGIRSFPVGITDYIIYEELISIAGGDSSRVFTTKTFDKLIELLAPVSIAACPNDV